MKKISILISSIVLLASISSAFASIKVGALPEQPWISGKAYVGDIVAAALDNVKPQEILIVTGVDNKNNETRLEGLSIRIDGKDFPFGLTLANSVGKKIAVIFDNSKYDISQIMIITDDYWYPHK